ncbi:MAG: hypothetical protein NVSMB70_02830 [Chamaesiphon sp.]
MDNDNELLIEDLDFSFLPQLHKRAVILYYFEEKPRYEVAKTLNISIELLRKVLKEAIKILRLTARPGAGTFFNGIM